MGWYIFNDGLPIRGPFEHRETAAVLRAEMERNASDRQNELWNLQIVPDTIDVVIRAQSVQDQAVEES